MVVSRSHPRYESLMIRERLVKGYEDGFVAVEGLMAHGRGEAFDYLLGERTGKAAGRALRAAAASMLTSERPVISVNGNAAALCAKEMVELAGIVGAETEVNLFYGGWERRRKVAGVLEECGAVRVLGTDERRSERLSGTDSPRRVVDRDGIHKSDLVLIALEDGDRAAALKEAGKRVVAFDLNPLSRTAETADVSIIDNVARGMAELASIAKEYRERSESWLREITDGFDNRDNLAICINEIRENLTGRARIAQIGR